MFNKEISDLINLCLENAHVDVVFDKYNKKHVYKINPDLSNKKIKIVKKSVYAILRKNLLKLNKKKEKLKKQQITNEYFMESCETFFKQKYTSENTIKQAIGMCRNRIFKTGFAETTNDFLQNIDKIYALMLEENVSKECKRKAFIYASDLLKYLKKPEKSKKFHDVFKRLTTEIFENRKKNEIRGEKEEKALVLSLDNLSGNEIKQNNINTLDLVYNLLVFIPETPRLDYRTLIYEPKNKNVSSIKRNNNGTYTITLINYKNSKFYGPWIIPVRNKSLVKYIDEYIKKKGIQINTLFIPNNKGSEHTSSNFSKTVTRAFQKRTGTEIGIDELRKIKERDMSKDYGLNTKSTKEIEDFTKKFFRHTIATSMIYYRRQPQKKDSKKEARRIANRKYYLKNKIKKAS